MPFEIRPRFTSVSKEMKLNGAVMPALRLMSGRECPARTRAGLPWRPGPHASPRPGVSPLSFNLASKGGSKSPQSAAPKVTPRANLRVRSAEQR